MNPTFKDIIKNSQVPWIKNRTIYLTTHGSRAYNTHLEDSDFDFKGVAIAPKEYYLGYLKKFEQNEIGDPYDAVIYDIQKFFKLASDCNPNIIEVLFSDDSDVILTTKHGNLIRESRDLFVSKKAKYTFGGYAYSQLKRAKTHRNYILYPPKKPPERKEFGLPEHRKPINTTEIGSFNSLIEEGYEFSNEVMETLQKEKQYQSKMREWKQYQNWIKTRNSKRFVLEKKCGYDPKNAMHLIRLLRMCKEILQGKGIIVKRPDRDELLEIRNGNLNYEQIIEISNRLQKECDELYETSTLPHSPNRKEIDKLCVRIIEEINHDRRLS